MRATAKFQSMAGWVAAAWLQKTLIAQMRDLGFQHLSIPISGKDGMQTGLDVDTYVHLAQVSATL